MIQQMLAEWKALEALHRRVLAAAFGALGLFVLLAMLMHLGISNHAGEAKENLGGDLELTLQQGNINQLKNKLQFDTRVSAVIDVNAQAVVQKNKEKKALIHLKAVDNYYPLYGDLKLQGKKAQPLSAAIGKKKNQKMHGIVVDRELLRALKVKQGAIIRIGKAQFRIRGVIKNEPDRHAMPSYSALRAVTSLQGLRAAGLGNQPQISRRLLVRFSESVDGQALIDKLRADPATPPFTCRGWHAMLPSYAQRMLDWLHYLYPLAIAAWVFAALSTAIVLWQRRQTA